MMLDFDDITPRDVMNTRITLYRQGQNPTTDKGVHMDIAPNETIPSLFKHAAERLGVVDINKIVNMDGDVVDDIVMINQDDILYALVQGEDFQRRTSRRSETTFSHATSTMTKEKELEQLHERTESIDEEVGDELVGNYFLGKFLGSGSFGKVHIGTHRMTGEQVALKFMNKSELGSFQDAERVFTEIQCLNSLDHPNVIKLHQVIDLPDYMVLALEYASGGDLKEVVEAFGAIDEDRASHIFVQVLDGVTYCHRHNIVHYDLKLENILLTNVEAASHDSIISDTSRVAGLSVHDGDGGNGAEESHSRLATKTSKHVPNLFNAQVKIADFGLSQLANPGQTSDYSAGSLAYIAPEVLHGGETAGAPRDVWAMGVILFAMVTGRLPFMGSSYSEVSTSIKKGVYRFRDDEHVSESCKQMIAAMLAVNADERMTVSELRIMPWLDRGLPHTRAKTPADVKSAGEQMEKTSSASSEAQLEEEDSHLSTHSNGDDSSGDGDDGSALPRVKVPLIGESDREGDPLLHNSASTHTPTRIQQSRFSDETGLTATSPKLKGKPKSTTGFGNVNAHRKLLDGTSEVHVPKRVVHMKTTEIQRPSSSGGISTNSTASSNSHRWDNKKQTSLPPIKTALTPKHDSGGKKKQRGAFSPKSAPTSPNFR